MTRDPKFFGCAKAGLAISLVVGTSVGCGLVKGDRQNHRAAKVANDTDDADAVQPGNDDKEARSGTLHLTQPEADISGSKDQSVTLKVNLLSDDGTIKIERSYPYAPGKDLEIGALPVNSYTLTITIANADGPLFTGSSKAAVESGKTTPVDISLKKVESGTIDVHITPDGSPELCDILKQPHPLMCAIGTWHCSYDNTSKTPEQKLEATGGCGEMPVKIQLYQKLCADHAAHPQSDEQYVTCEKLPPTPNPGDKCLYVPIGDCAAPPPNHHYAGAYDANGCFVGCGKLVPN